MKQNRPYSLFSFAPVISLRHIVRPIEPRSLRPAFIPQPESIGQLAGSIDISDSEFTPETLERIQWLVEVGAPQLRRLRTPDAVEELRQMRCETWQKSMLKQQLEFHKRSKQRFPDPLKWLWTDRSLAQASDWWTAHFKAQLIPPRTRVIDACCGAGADAVALAHHHPVCALDQNPVCVALAKGNISSHALEAEVIQRTASPEIIQSHDWLHIDPDRRASGRKSLNAEDFSPPIEDTIRMAQRAAGAMIKVAPRTETMGFEQAMDGGLRLWTGWGGECRQQLLLVGDALAAATAKLGIAAQSTRMAIGLDKHSPYDEQLANSTTYAGVVEESSVAERAGRFVYDLSPMLHAAELQGSWANAHGLAAIGNAQGYFTSDQRLSNNLVQGFEVVEEVGWDDRKVRRCLRALQAGNVEVKCRLLTLDANRYQKRYSQPGGNPVTILVTRLGNRTRAILTRRLSHT